MNKENLKEFFENNVQTANNIARDLYFECGTCSGIFYDTKENFIEMVENLEILELLENIDYDNFNIWHNYFKYDTYGKWVSIENLYEDIDEDTIDEIISELEFATHSFLSQMCARYNIDPEDVFDEEEEEDDNND